MKIDFKGTAPGATAPTPAPKVVNIRCKQCSGDKATEMTAPGTPPGIRMYRCLDCEYSWHIHVGGVASF